MNWSDFWISLAQAGLALLVLAVPASFFVTLTFGPLVVRLAKALKPETTDHFNYPFVK